jgi:hypothetical protein
MQSIDRWRKWRPSDEILDGLPEQAPPKPSKATSEGSEGVSQEPDQVISSEQICNTDGTDSLDSLRPHFVKWFDASVYLDVEWIARCRPGPRWCAGLNALHSHFCRWMLDLDEEVPPTPVEFTNLLEELGCEIRNFDSDQLVLGVALKEDVEAQWALRS